MLLLTMNHTNALTKCQLTQLLCTNGNACRSMRTAVVVGASKPASVRGVENISESHCGRFKELSHDGYRV